MGLTTGPVPPRVDASVKAGLLALVDHAVDRGWTRRRACRLLDLDEDRAGRWNTRRQGARRAGGDEAAVLAALADEIPGGHPLHGLLEEERAAIVELYEAWGQVDRSHRKLAHRGSRLDLVYVSESSVRRVLADHGLVLAGPRPRPPRERAAWPDWLEWRPNRLWGYDFSHFTRAGRCVIAVLDIVSRKWLTTLVSAEESSTQVEVCFLDALRSEGLMDLIEERDDHDCDVEDCYEHLRQALLSGSPERLNEAVAGGTVPLLLTISDNGPQMRSHTTREFLAGAYIAQQFGRPGVPTDQAWIETLFGHVRCSSVFVRFERWDQTTSGSSGLG